MAATLAEQENEKEVYSNFVDSILSKFTKTVYIGHLKRFMKFCNASSYSDLLKMDANKQLIKYTMASREEGISANSISNRLNAVFHFYSMNDVTLNKNKIKRFKGEHQRKTIDRAYSVEEISKILQVSDSRMKVIISLMYSSGLRIGAIPLLKMRNLEKMENLYKVTVYEGTNDQYYTFCTPECVSFIDSYLEFRQKNGEKLNPDSYLIRDQFKITDIEKIRNRSKPIKYNTLRTILDLVLLKSGVRTIDHTSKHNRKEVAKAHGFRKFFSTALVDAGVITEYRWLLEGHDLPKNDPSYVKPINQLYAEYNKAVNNLTINEENRLKMKLEKLEIEKNNFDSLAADIAQIKEEIKNKK